MAISKYEAKKELMEFWRECTTSSSSGGASKPSSALTVQLQQHTHLLMNGGAASIPPRKLGMLYNLLGTALEVGCDIPMIEVAGDVFRFFMDIDFTSWRELCAEEIILLCKTIQTVVRRFFRVQYDDGEFDTPGDADNYVFGMIILTSKKPPHSSTAAAAAAAAAGGGSANGSAAKMKTGIHAVMPELYVTKEQCLTIRASVVLQIQNVLLDGIWAMVDNGELVGKGSRPEDFVDRAVYGKAGSLRMPGCAKWGICSLCQNKPALKKTCDNCTKNGKVCIGREYYARWELRGNGEIAQNEYLCHIRWQLSQCTIRDAREAAAKASAAVEAIYECPNNVPRDVPEMDKARNAKRYDSGERGNLINITNPVILRAALSAIKRTMTQLFDVPLDELKELRIHALDMINPPATRKPKCIMQNTDGSSFYARTFFATINGPFMTCCGNLKRDNINGVAAAQCHNSSRNWWLIKDMTIVQRCFSIKQQSDKILSASKTCKEYASHPHAVSADEGSVLFSKDIIDPVGSSSSSSSSSTTISRGGVGEISSSSSSSDGGGGGSITNFYQQQHHPLLYRVKQEVPADLRVHLFGDGSRPREEKTFSKEDSDSITQLEDIIKAFRSNMSAKKSSSVSSSDANQHHYSNRSSDVSSSSSYAPPQQQQQHQTKKMRYTTTSSSILSTTTAQQQRQ